jgi:chromosome segregation ATPase
MRLEALEIAGFKSFGKKARLEFDAPITAIVGPNGSGKSNVAEAFRFVLGEQSIKSMRGKKGEDLIFNGQISSGRQNKASVKVVLANHDRTLNIDYDTVTLERVVHRDGVNEYFINGSAVRLKDIVELLSGANIGSTGHHIISQGEADRILNSSPKERRAMLEDALGLKMYQYKKIESEKKLVKTEENIAQVESLRKEIQPHLKFLKKQVEKIEQVRVFQEQLTTLYAEYLKHESVLITHERARLTNAFTEPRKNIELVTHDIAAYQAEVAASKQGDGKTDALIALEDELQSIRETKNTLLREVGQLEGEIKSIERLQEREERTQQDVTVKLHEVETLERQVHDLVEQATTDDVSMLKQVLQSIKALVGVFISERRNSTPQAEHSLAQELAPLKQKRDGVLVAIQEHVAQETVVVGRVSAARQEIEASKTGMLEAERKVFELQTKKSELEGMLNRLRMEQDTLDRRDEEFKREIQEAIVLIGRQVHQYETFVLDTATALAEDVYMQQERRRALEKLKIRVEELGTGSSHEVLKEFEEVTERDAFLVREIQDLETSSVSLRQLITDLDEEINRRFRTGVQSINNQFQHFFELMFGGGEAGLRLVVPEVRKKRKDTDISFDVDEPTTEEQEQEEGVDIHISLPRKKVKGLMMLSGGERALTSIALIFAMSAVNPPPFIILDETDAALDEANAKKYADMVQHLAAQSQLILITHNRETMSRASTIYGVTMMQGISELLSIKFDQGVQYAK